MKDFFYVAHMSMMPKIPSQKLSPPTLQKLIPSEPLFRIKGTLYTEVIVPQSRIDEGVTWVVEDMVALINEGGFSVKTEQVPRTHMDEVPDYFKS